MSDTGKKYQKTRIFLRMVVIGFSIGSSIQHNRALLARLDKIDKRLEAYDRIITNPVMSMSRPYGYGKVPRQRRPTDG